MTVQEAITIAERALPGQAAPDDVEDPRWQAIIVIGDFVENDPEEVWLFVERWGHHDDEDLRTAIATCLLEHLLEYHFDSIFPRVERAVGASARFADTFSRCFAFGQSEMPANISRFERLKEKCQRAS